VKLDAVDKHQRRRQADQAMRTLLGEQLGQDPQQLRFGTAAGGKPYLVDGGLQFNLSHSGEVACVASSPAVAVGVDVERVRAFKNEDGIRRRICSPVELASLPRLAAAIGSAEAALIQLWVRKEAVVKASGEGIVRDLNEFSVLEELVDDGHGGRWRCLDLPAPQAGYLAAVAFAAT
jgi:4'-phosphopantetheinyl transferase